MDKKSRVLYKCFIDGTGNNIFVSVVDMDGRLISQCSAGIVGMNGPRKRTPYAAEITAKQVGERIKVLNVKKLSVYIRGKISKVVRGAIRGLFLAGIDIKDLVLLNTVAHNGVRLPKIRRK